MTSWQNFNIPIRIQIPKGHPRQKMYIKIRTFSTKTCFSNFLFRATITLQNKNLILHILLVEHKIRDGTRGLTFAFKMKKFPENCRFRIRIHNRFFLDSDAQTKVHLRRSGQKIRNWEQLPALTIEDNGIMEENILLKYRKKRLLSFKNHVNVASKSNNQKTWIRSRIRFRTR